MRYLVHREFDESSRERVRCKLGFCRAAAWRTTSRLVKRDALWDTSTPREAKRSLEFP